MALPRDRQDRRPIHDFPDIHACTSDEMMLRVGKADLVRCLRLTDAAYLRVCERLRRLEDAGTRNASAEGQGIAHRPRQHGHREPERGNAASGEQGRREGIITTPGRSAEAAAELDALAEENRALEAQNRELIEDALATSHGLQAVVGQLMLQLRLLIGTTSEPGESLTARLEESNDRVEAYRIELDRARGL